MKHYEKLKKLVLHPQTKISIALFIGIIVFAGLVQTFAGEDLLKDTTGDAVSTIKGSGTKWAYIGEGITALLAYIKTKNFAVLFGVVVVAVFINLLIKLVTQ